MATIIVTMTTTTSLFVLVFLDQAGKGYQKLGEGKKKTGCQISPATLSVVVQILFVHGERLRENPGDGKHTFFDRQVCARPALFSLFVWTGAKRDRQWFLEREPIK